MRVPNLTKINKRSKTFPDRHRTCMGGYKAFYLWWWGGGDYSAVLIPDRIIVFLITSASV